MMNVIKKCNIFEGVKDNGDSRTIQDDLEADPLYFIIT